MPGATRQCDGPRRARDASQSRAQSHASARSESRGPGAHTGLGAARGQEPIPGAAPTDGAGRPDHWSAEPANGPDSRGSRGDRMRGTGQRAWANRKYRIKSVDQSDRPTGPGQP